MSAPIGPIEDEVGRLRALQREGRHGDVVPRARALACDAPENRDLLLIAAISQRHLMRIAEALATLDELERLQPRFSRMHQERGLCHVVSRDAPRAVDSLLRAVNINPALRSSWSMLERLYRLTGDAQNADVAGAHLAVLAGLPPEVVSATSLFSDGEIAAAETLVRDFLVRAGEHPEAMRLLAKIAIARDVLDDAELLLEATLALAPGHHAARYEYAQTLAQRQKYAQAREQIRRLLASDPSNLEHRSLEASITVGLGEHEAAVALYQAMLADAPQWPDLHLWLGHALKTLGRLPEATERYRAAAALRVDFGDAYWSLANLKVHRFDDDEIGRMQAGEAAVSTTAEDRQHLAFALGKAFEDREDWDRSWSYYERGNALKRAQGRYDPAHVEINTHKQREVCTRAFFEHRRGWGAVPADPIFIVGLPRSGSTLLEQILASHSRVEGTQELSEVPRLVLELQGRDSDPGDPRYPAALVEMSREAFTGLGARYLTETSVFRTDKPFFIDKMPNNFRHLG